MIITSGGAYSVEKYAVLPKLSDNEILNINKD